MQNFGRLEPKDRGYEDVYPVSKLFGLSGAVKSVERKLTIPYSLRTFYNQGNYNACVGVSASWLSSINNSVPQQKYDWLWLYHQAQLNDGNPSTRPDSDVGTYVWAAFWVLQHLGHKKPGEGAPDMRDGITSYYWAKNSDDVRTSIALGRPVVIGVRWYEGFMNPQYLNGEYWLCKTSEPGVSLGGHATTIVGASDKRQAFLVLGSWGRHYPIVWLTYKMFDRLMKENGEAVVAIDRSTVT